MRSFEIASIQNIEFKYMKLHDWIPIDKVNWTELSENPNAVQLLVQHLDKVDWHYLSSNLNTIPIINKKDITVKLV
jgi:hypothetical protein